MIDLVIDWVIDDKIDRIINNKIDRMIDNKTIHDRIVVAREIQEEKNGRTTVQWPQKALVLEQRRKSG